MPDLATFAVDDGFSYAVADTMELRVGSIVRVPLGGRRVRGWVTGVRRGDGTGLKGVIGVSGAQPVFTAELLQVLRWAAVHYVAPVAALLGKAGPPNLPQVGRARLDELPDLPDPPPEVGELVAHLASSRRTSPAFVAGPGPWTDQLASLLAAAAAGGGKSSLVVVPTAADCGRLAGELSGRFGNRVVAATSAAPAADRTRAWSRLSGAPGSIVVGTAEVMLWPVSAGGLAVVADAGRRAMKARQTPTLHVREVMRRRSVVERFTTVLVGRLPTLETAAAGAELLRPPGRMWPLVEIADRTEEPPSRAPLADATRAAISGAVRRGEPVFVFVSRRGYAPAMRCASCGELRRCPECGSNPGPGTACDRCGAAAGPCSGCGAASFVPVGAGVGRVLEELRRDYGAAVTPAGEGGSVQVGTERDLPGAGSVGLAVVIDADSMLLRPHYRAEEDTLQVLTRVAAAVRRGRGHRCLIQTRMAQHRVLQAMRHGNGDVIVADWLAERRSEQLPPFGELLAVELTPADAAADEELRAAAGPAIAVFGPAPVDGRARWLLQAPDLRPCKVRLRQVVQRWRDRGLKVRLDADPLDV